MGTPTNQRVKRTQRDYILAFKRTVVQQLEQGSLTTNTALKADGVDLVA